MSADADSPGRGRVLGKERMEGFSDGVFGFAITLPVRRFRSWDRDAPEREWAGLEVLHQYAPGLAPQSLEWRVEDGVPVIVMSRAATAEASHGAYQSFSRCTTARPASRRKDSRHTPQS